ncbi:MAG: nitroreductase family protein [Thermodesulfovibrionales bacterium]|nr:nitroreductase family protein [Thermodesulfovibrionales bacterium]
MDVIGAIRTRRSINFFDPSKKIPEDGLKELIEISNLAPSSFNLQPWKVIIVTDPEKKKILRKCAFDQPKVEEASAVLIIIADPASVEENIERVLNSWQQLGYMRQEMRGVYKDMASKLYGEPASLKRKLFAVKNASLFAMTLMLAAKGLGFDTHPMDGFDEDCVKREFNIPEDKIIPMLIAVGYLREGITLLPRAWRRDYTEFVRYNSY